MFVEKLVGTGCQWSCQGKHTPYLHVLVAQPSTDNYHWQCSTVYVKIIVIWARTENNPPHGLLCPN